MVLHFLLLFLQKIVYHTYKIDYNIFDINNTII